MSPCLWTFYFLAGFSCVLTRPCPSQIRETGRRSGESWPPRIFPVDWSKPESAEGGIAARTPWQPSTRAPVVGLLQTASFTAAICPWLTQLSERGKADNNGRVVKMNRMSADSASPRTHTSPHYMIDNWSVKCYFQGFRRSTRRSKPVLEARKKHKSTAQFAIRSTCSRLQFFPIGQLTLIIYQ